MRGQISPWDIVDETAFLKYDATTKVYKVTYEDMPAGNYETKAVTEISPGGSFSWTNAIPASGPNVAVKITDNSSYKSTSGGAVATLAKVTVAMVRLNVMSSILKYFELTADLLLLTESEAEDFKRSDSVQP